MPPSLYGQCQCAGSQLFGVGSFSECSFQWMVEGFEHYFPSSCECPYCTEIQQPAPTSKSGCSMPKTPSSLSLHSPLLSIESKTPKCHKDSLFRPFNSLLIMELSRQRKNDTLWVTPVDAITPTHVFTFTPSSTCHSFSDTSFPLTESSNCCVYSFRHCSCFSLGCRMRTPSTNKKSIHIASRQWWFGIQKQAQHKS